MLHSLSLESFRSWEDRQTLRTAKLTLLAGANNTGKSSFLAALEALIQSEQANSRDELQLSGEWVDLGPFDELLPPARGEGGCSIGCTGTSPEGPVDVVWDFQPCSEALAEKASLSQLEARLGETHYLIGRDSKGLSMSVDGGEPRPAILTHPLSFLATSGPRQGEWVRLLPYRPEQVLPVGPFRAPPMRNVFLQRSGSAGPPLGRFGEYAAEIAWTQRSREVDVLPQVPGPAVATDLFERAIHRWYSYVLDQNLQLRVEELRRLGFKVLIDTPGMEDLSFNQVGFGLSQIWPIIVAALASRPGELVIVETPEAHLHPAAQHRLAQLFVELTRRGRQVFVETHSEHVLASICLGVKNGTLLPQDVAVHYFEQQQGRTVTSEIELDVHGRRLQAPRGFFDQASLELLELLR